MKPRVALVLFIAGLALLSAVLMISSCSRTGADVLRVTSPLPEGVVPRDGAIALTFSRGVVPPDSLNLWTATPFITFTPEIPGKFVWQDTSRLVFSPDGPFAGDTRFTGAINTALLMAMSGAASFSGESDFTFSTSRFMLEKAEFFYDRMGEKRQVGIKANLEFTYAVDPQEILQKVSITVDGETKPLARVVTAERNRLIAVEIGTFTQLEKERKISLSVDKELISPETNTHIWMEEPYTVTLPPLGQLQIFGHEAGFDGTAGWIHVRVSQELDTSAIRTSLVLEPVRPFGIRLDPDGFTIRGQLEPGTSFRMTIRKGLESVLGGTTGNDYDATILIGNVAPSFRFASKGGTYMLLGGARSVELRTVNLPKLAVRVSQVFQNNLVHFLDEGRYYDYWSEEGDDSEEGGGRRKYRYRIGNYGRQLRFDTLETAGAANQEAATWLDLSPFLNTGYRGFFVVDIADPAQAWRSTSKLVSISDLGLIVKRSHAQVLVFVTSLLTNEPVSGAQVSLISTNNQTIASAKSSGDGVASFEGPEALAKDFELKLVTAELDGDFNFLNLSDYLVETSRFDVAGKRIGQGVYDAMLYGDRNLYRPGEKLIISGLVRDLRGPLPEKMPVRLRITNPRGSIVSDQQLVLNEEGSFETSWQTSPTSMTGAHHAALYTGNMQYLTSYQVGVEDFVPDRLRVTLKPSSATAKPGETLTYDLLALNFFGPPAAGRNWEFEGTFDNLPYRSKTFAEFRFADDATKAYSADPVVFTGETDEAGKATIRFPIPRQLLSPGILRARGRIAVFDESGRPVYQIGQTLVYPREYFIGVRYQGAYYVSPNTPQKVKIVAVDMNDRPINGFKAKIDLIRSEWHTVLREHPSTKTLRYVSERREIPVKSDIVTLGNDPLEYAFAVPRSGDYAVRVSRSGDAGYNSFSFYSYEWGSSSVTSFEVDPEARVEIVTDREKYAPGETARILFQAPFSGTMLVTVEQNRVLDHRYLKVVDNAASMELSIEDHYLPNVYISAVLFRKVTESDIPLLAGHGFRPLFVEKSSNRLDVAIKAPEKIRPRTKQKVTIIAGTEKNVFVTLAAVDEGICQLKNYATPDPYGFFYARRALETESYDFFRDLLPEAKRGTERSSSGGGEGDIGQRANPLGVQRFKPLAIWSGIRSTNSSGEVEVELEIPEFQGELRLMAFAYKGKRFGSAQLPMKVSDPVVITPALPRFLAPQDSLLMGITAFNTTTRPASLTFEISTKGGLVAPVRTVSLEVGPNQERVVDVPLRSTNEIGAASVTVRAKAFGETLESTTELPIRPVSPYASSAITGQIDGGSSVSHPIEDVYLPYGRRAHVSISPFPVANFAGQLKHLIGYPHGCLEQTVSKAFPQIYLRDIAAVLAPSLTGTGSPTYFVNEAISKVASMQRHDGGFWYWPGWDMANNWTTVYATHFLLEARNAGYAVPEGTLKPALAALAGISRGRKTETYHYWTENRVVARTIADKSCVYALYVLALAGSPEKSVMNFYRSEKGLLTGDTRTLLAGAFALSGDRSTFRELLPAQFTTEEAQRTTGGCFDSPIRANALILNILLETDLNNPNIPRYEEYLSKIYRTSRWFSTQDDAFVLLAFGKAARLASAAKLTGTVTAGKAKQSYKGGTEKFAIDPFGSTVSISLAGEGRGYYSIVTEGIRSDGGVALEDKNLQVRRDFLTREGNPFDLALLKQNDLVVVRITLNSSVEVLDNVAVTDLLPAGFEIENPRITEATTYAFIKNAATPEYQDIRDDRMNIYTSFRGHERQKVFYYAVRAVTRGRFALPAIVAEAMYDANYYSASGTGSLRVGR